MKRLVSALAVGCLLLGLAPTALAAGPTRQFERVDRNLDKIDPEFRSMLADKTRKLTVVLELRAQPALALEASAADRKVKAHTLRATQGRLDARIDAIGAKVLHRYQYAYNGIKVRATGAQLRRLAAMPGVVGVRHVATYKRDNVKAVPYVGAPTAWQTSGVTGAGQTIAVIDTGIDYTHANFGGPGTTEAYDDNDPTLIEDGTFPTAKVVAGYDFAGNDYDAEGDAGSTTPTPDPDPLDCGDHGSHVAGSAAGQGVLADHSTYTGPYNSSIYSDPDTFVVGPGVAPKAKLIALKVFGCEGSTDLVVDALEWVAGYNISHVDGIDVVNMSLGSVFGRNGEPDVIATNNLVGIGVVVVASAGNSNAVPFVTGSPAASTKAISVAALDAFPTIPLALVDLPTDPDIAGNNQNAYPALPVSGTLHVVPDGLGGVSLGCTAGDYDAASAGKIVAIKRGVCAFVDKGAAAAEAGAIGIIMINRDDTAPGDLPTFVGYNPELFEIPMVGVDKTAQPTLLANEGAAITLAPQRHDRESHLQADRGLQLVRSALRRQLAEAGRRRAGRQHAVVAQRQRLERDDLFRDVHGVTDHRRDRRARALEASGLVPAPGQGRHRQHRERLVQGARLQPAPLRLGRGPGQPRGQHRGPRHHQPGHREPLVRLRDVEA